MPKEKQNINFTCSSNIIEFLKQIKSTILGIEDTLTLVKVQEIYNFGM